MKTYKCTQCDVEYHGRGLVENVSATKDDCYWCLLCLVKLERCTDGDFCGLCGIYTDSLIISPLEVYCEDHGGKYI